MFRFACVLLAFGLAKAQECFHGDLTMPGGAGTMSQSDLLAMLDASVTQSAMAIMQKDAGFRKFMETRQPCQHTCMDKVADMSFRTLIANLGNDFFNPDSENIASEALTGSFMACYPSPPRDQVKNTIDVILMNMGKPAKPADIAADGDKCDGPEGAAAGDRTSFMEEFKDKFPKALDKVCDAHPGLKDELALSKPCQQECVQSTLLDSVRNLWDSGLVMADNNDEITTKALTGAIKACFPRVPRDNVLQLVTEIGKAFDSASETTRLYQAKQIPAIASSYAPTVGLGAGVLVTVFWAGMVVGKRMRHRGRDALINGSPDLE